MNVKSKSTLKKLENKMRFRNYSESTTEIYHHTSIKTLHTIKQAL